MKIGLKKITTEDIAASASFGKWKKVLRLNWPANFSDPNAIENNGSMIKIRVIAH